MKIYDIPEIMPISKLKIKSEVNGVNGVVAFTSRLEVRKDKDVNSSTIGEIHKGEAVKVLKETGNWKLVEYYDKDKEEIQMGWCIDDYIACGVGIPKIISAERARIIQENLDAKTSIRCNIDEFMVLRDISNILENIIKNNIRREVVITFYKINNDSFLYYAQSKNDRIVVNYNNIIDIIGQLEHLGYECCCGYDEYDKNIYEVLIKW